MLDPTILPGVTSADLKPMPITPEWVVDGTPVARGKILATSRDKTSQVFVWECTPGIFNWHFNVGEEVAYIISGEVFVSTDGRPERHLKPGDVAVFPSGSSCTWRITNPVQKIGVLRKPMPRFFGVAVRAWNRMLCNAGRVSPAPFIDDLPGSISMAR